MTTCHRAISLSFAAMGSHMNVFRLHSTKYNILGHVLKAKVTAAAEAAGRPPPSDALLCIASRAAVNAHMCLAVAEHQLAQVQGLSEESWQRLYLDILMQVRFLLKVSVRLQTDTCLLDLAVCQQERQLK